MTDTRTPEQRRRIMKSVGTQNTGPELVVRRLVCRLGYRYRLHYPALPGRPDLAFLGRKKAIFIHGCFWHNHGCSKGKAPKSRLDYWKPKLDANRARDVRQLSDLALLGWSVLTIWQCELADLASLEARIVDFLEPDSNRSTTLSQSANLGKR